MIKAQNPDELSLAARRKLVSDAIGAFERLSRSGKARGAHNGALGHVGCDVFQHIADHGAAFSTFVTFRTDEIGQALGYARSSVIEAVKRLKAHGLLVQDETKKRQTDYRLVFTQDLADAPERDRAE